MGVGALRAGYYVDASNVYHGFLRTRDGTFTTFDAPGAGTDPYQGTWMDLGRGSINPVGAITGYYCDATTCHGFLRDKNGTFTTLDPPDSGYTRALSINPQGAITGFYCDAITCHGFLRHKNGTFTTFDPPDSGNTLALSINSQGAITGFYCDAITCHGFLRAPDGSFTTIDVPGAASTVPYSINSAGTITGSYTDANGLNHAFLWLPE